MASGTAVRVFVELPSPTDAQPLDTCADAGVRWRPRPSGERPGAAVLEAVRASRFPAGVPYIWMAGESGMVRQVRRHLVGRRDIPRQAIRFIGYWRRAVA